MSLSSTYVNIANQLRNNNFGLVGHILTFSKVFRTIYLSSSFPLDQTSIDNIIFNTKLSLMNAMILLNNNLNSLTINYPTIIHLPCVEIDNEITS